MRDSMNGKEIRKWINCLLDNTPGSRPEDFEGEISCVGLACPDCGAPLIMEWEDDYQMLPPLSVTPEAVEENVYHCALCGSSWKSVDGGPLERYFFG